MDQVATIRSTKESILAEQLDQMLHQLERVVRVSEFTERALQTGSESEVIAMRSMVLIDCLLIGSAPIVKRFGEVNSYSIQSEPHEDDNIEFLVNIQPARDMISMVGIIDSNSPMAQTSSTTTVSLSMKDKVTFFTVTVKVILLVDWLTFVFVG